MAANAQAAINEAAERNGWIRLEHRIHENVLARAKSRMIIGYSSTGRALSIAMYFPDGIRHYVDGPEPMRSVGRGDLATVLAWLNTGDPDPISPSRQSLVLIPCAATKLSHPAPAGELYDSAHFRFTLRAGRARAHAIGARVAILSARHGIIDPRIELAPYNVTIGDPEATTPRTLAGQLAVWRIGHIETLLPARYLKLTREAVELLHSSGTVLRLDNLFQQAPGIGYQRAVLKQMLGSSRPPIDG